MSTATFPEVTFAQWRAAVEKELAGKPFDKTLVHEALAGVGVAPLYTEAPTVDAAARLERTAPFRICMRHEAGASVEDLVADVTGGADALWLPFAAATKSVLERPELKSTTFVLEASEVPAPGAAALVDPLAWRARGSAPFATLSRDLEATARLAAAAKQPSVLVSTEPYHDAGADAADEIAIALSTAVAYLEALLAGGVAIDDAVAAMAVRMPVGRDTFVELCKLRALRVCFAKLFAASGAKREASLLVHAVCSAQTLTVRDPWVNMLRVTTQVFAGVLGGADLVTPNAFDRAFGKVSALGQRVARNTGLVLREESALGKVSDPAGGSYYFDSLTDTLARRGWTKFQELSASGGVAKLLESGELARRLEAGWTKRLDAIAKRKQPILGVSEFANLGETLPHAVPASESSHAGLPIHRDAAAFEALRNRAAAAPEVLLLTLGTFAESRARAGFAANFFSAGGLRTREVAKVEAAPIVCLCGTDERYAEEAVARATELKKAGVARVMLAGRPGPREAELRAAGIDGFLFVGRDVVAVLEEAAR